MSRRPPRLVLGLLSAERSLRRWLEERSQRVGTTAAGAGALFAAAREGGATVSQIAAELNGSVSGTSGLIDRLQRAGLVIKRRDPGDGRGVRVQLTDQGRAAVREAHVVLDALNARICEGFSDEELLTVQRWLGHVGALADPTKGRGVPPA